MKESNIKEMMEQVHIPEEMREQIIIHLEDRMESGNCGVRKWRKPAVAAAVFLLAAAAAGVPVYAVFQNMVKARMEEIPKEEVKDIENMIQRQAAEADSFSRLYTEEEKERDHELWRAYKEGKFPGDVIRQVDSPKEAEEGTLCYIRSTGEFHLPEREMTDEELLEIIDFQHKMSYAISQGEAAQEEKAQKEAEQAELEERVQAAGGIGRERALEIAGDYLESETGDMAAEMELEQISLCVMGDAINYLAVYSRAGGHPRYFIIISSADASILKVEKLGGS